MNFCHLCKGNTVEELIDFGSQPVCNRFLSDPAAQEYGHPMRLGFCGWCGLIQLTDPVPISELQPKFDWITYTEPERHLDSLAEIISGLPGLQPNSAFCGISFKDDPLLDRLNKRGFGRTRRLDLKKDLDIADGRVGVETVQDRMNPSRSKSLAKTHGPADVVIARHILEHSFDVSKFIRSLRELLTPGGYLVLEIPDCTRAIEKLDYSTLWEEHILYFTQASFQQAISTSGFFVVRSEVVPYALEDVLVSIVQPKKDASPAAMESGLLKKEQARGLAFRDGLDDQRRRYRGLFLERNLRRENVAVFGAGHLSCAFINLLGLADHVNFVVDDHPRKQGLFMPGSRRPITGSAKLADSPTRLCLMGLNPDAESKVIQNNQAYTARGGQFASIFPASPSALALTSGMPHGSRVSS